MARVFRVLLFSFSSSLAYEDSSLLLSLCCLFCLISAMFTRFVLWSVSRFVLFRLLVEPSFQRPALASFVSCFLAKFMCKISQRHLYLLVYRLGAMKICYRNGLIDSLTYNGLLFRIYCIVHSNILSFGFDHIYCDHYYSWGRPFYTFFCACCIDSFLQTWIFLWSYH